MHAARSASLANAVTGALSAAALEISAIGAVYLHGRRRQQQEALGAFLQGPHQPQQRVGAIDMRGCPSRSRLRALNMRGCPSRSRLRAPGGAAPGVVGFVQHDHVPRLDFLQQNSGAILATHQTASCNART